jgi:superfamily II DNA/RNA helicase
MFTKGICLTPSSSPSILPFFFHSWLQMNIKEFFPVQAAVSPAILQARFTNDVCVAAPTGSGKTLGYVLPILQVSFLSTSFHVRILKLFFIYFRPLLIVLLFACVR